MIDTAPELVPDLLRARAACDGDEVALVTYGRRPVTFGEWNHAANAVANALIDGGLRVGTRVGLVFSEAEWDDYAINYMGVLKAGATVVPLSTSIGTTQALEIFVKLDVNVVIGGAHAGELHHRHTVFSSDELRAHASTTEVQVPITPSSPADIVCTSGSTGTPKAVCVSHENLTYGLSTEDLEKVEFSGPAGYSVRFTPLGTNAAQKNLVQGLVRQGRVFVMLPYFEPSLFARVVAEFSPTSVGLVPATALALHRSPDVPADGFPCVGAVTLSSSPVSRSTLETVRSVFPDATIFDLYGSTEVGRGRLYRRCDVDKEEPFRPLAPCQVRVVDEENKDVPPGVVGEVLIWHPAPPRWYDNDAESTSRVFQEGGWVRTGDLGHLTADDAVHLAGRADDVIIAGGINVAPTEVEEALVRYPGILDAGVAGVPHPVLGQTVAAALVTDPDASIDFLDLRAYMLSALGRHKAPRQMVRVASLPRTLTLKTDRQAISELISTHPAAAEVTDAPGEALSSTAAHVLALAREITDLPTLGPADDLFQVGLDSLTALELSLRMAETFGITVDPWICFDYPTPTLLAEQVDLLRESPAH